jgi:hypothetical protein
LPVDGDGDVESIVGERAVPNSSDVEHHPFDAVQPL